jgi:hypothetical protein
MACTSFAMSICIFTEVNIKAASGSLKDRTSGPSQGDMEHYGPCWRQCRSIHPYMFTLHFESMEGMIDFVWSREITYILYLAFNWKRGRALTRSWLLATKVFLFAESSC